MADPLSITLGVLSGVNGVARLFTTCVDLFNFVDNVQAYGQNHALLSSQLDIEKTLLLQWAQRVRLFDNHPDLRFQDDHTTAAVFKALNCVKLLLGDTEKLKTSYGLSQDVVEGYQSHPSFTSTTLSTSRLHRMLGSFPRFQQLIRENQKQTSFYRKTMWIVADSDKFKALLDDLRWFIRSLNELMPDRSSLQYDMTMEDLAPIANDFHQLDLVEAASRRVHPALADAASEMASIASVNSVASSEVGSMRTVRDALSVESFGPGRRKLSPTPSRSPAADSQFPRNFEEEPVQRITDVPISVDADKHLTATAPSERPHSKPPGLSRRASSLMGPVDSSVMPRFVRRKSVQQPSTTITEHIHNLPPEPSSTEGLDRIARDNVVELMDHLTVRDAQRNARDTEVLVTLVRRAAEIRNSFEEMKNFFENQDVPLPAATDVELEHDQTFVKRTKVPAKPDGSVNRRNMFKRALPGVDFNNSTELCQFEIKLEQLLMDINNLRKVQGESAVNLSEPVSDNSLVSPEYTNDLRTTSANAVPVPEKTGNLIGPKRLDKESTVRVGSVQTGNASKKPIISSPFSPRVSRWSSNYRNDPDNLERSSTPLAFDSMAQLPRLPTFDEEKQSSPSSVWPDKRYESEREKRQDGLASSDSEPDHQISVKPPDIAIRRPEYPPASYVDHVAATRAGEPPLDKRPNASLRLPQAKAVRKLPRPRAVSETISTIEVTTSTGDKKQDSHKYSPGGIVHPVSKSLTPNAKDQAHRRMEESLSHSPSGSTITNPRLLETVEDAIRRLILPELKQRKKDQAEASNRRKRAPFSEQPQDAAADVSAGKWDFSNPTFPKVHQPESKVAERPLKDKASVDRKIVEEDDPKQDESGARFQSRNSGSDTERLTQKVIEKLRNGRRKADKKLRDDQRVSRKRRTVDKHVNIKRIESIEALFDAASDRHSLSTGSFVAFTNGEQSKRRTAIHDAIRCLKSKSPEELEATELLLTQFLKDADFHVAQSDACITQDIAAGENAGGALTATALKHHDSMWDPNRQERRIKRRKERSKTRNVIADTADRKVLHDGENIPSSDNRRSPNYGKHVELAESDQKSLLIEYFEVHRGSEGSGRPRFRVKVKPKSVQPGKTDDHILVKESENGSHTPPSIPDETSRSTGLRAIG